jgi:uncharacterized protein (DUF58 family)
MNHSNFQIFLTVSLFVGYGLIWLIFRRVSFEGKIILSAAWTSLIAFLRIRLYLLLLTSFSLFGFVVIALLWAVVAVMGVAVTRKVRDEAMAGESFPVEYQLSSRSLLPGYHVRLWDFANRKRNNSSEPVDFAEPGYASFLRIGSKKNEPVEGKLTLKPETRGQVKLGPVAVEVSDPFGIFVITRWIKIYDKVLVLPGWVRMTTIPSVLARLGSREHIHPVNREGHSHEFLGIRTWSEGDSLRRVHWPLTAKHNQLIVRQFQKEVEEEMVIIFDADKSADIGTGMENAFEYMIVIAMSLLNASRDVGRPWTLIIVGNELKKFSHQDRDSFTHIQYTLAEIVAEREDDIENYLDEIRRAQMSASYVLITPRTDSSPATALHSLTVAEAGEGTSMIIRVDPTTFASGVEHSAAKFKRGRGNSGQAKGSRYSPGVAQINELIFRRGNSVEEIFTGI